MSGRTARRVEIRCCELCGGDVSTSRKFGVFCQHCIGKRGDHTPPEAVVEPVSDGSEVWWIPEPDEDDEEEQADLDDD